MSTPATLIATLGGIGRAPQAPGTWASLATLPVAFVLHGLGGFPLFAAATGLCAVGGFLAVRAYLAGGDGDPPEVVIDEMLGMLLALWPLSFGLWLRGVDPWVFPWPGWVGAFLDFRYFDILKPPPIGRLERLPGAWGVMADDALAGVFAGIVVAAAALVAHGFLT